MPKLCEYETCRTRATYGINCEPIRCFQHKLVNMKLSSTLCKCGKTGPNFNYDGMKAKYCSECKMENMIDVKHKKCSCGKCQPTYNYEGLVANFCIECKKNDMIDVKHNMCFCGKVRPTFNYYREKAKYCSDCKLNNMIDVTEKRFCKNCNKTRPTFNYKDMKPEYCSKCKLNDMIDLVHKLCFCGKVQPTYNYKGKDAVYCKECKESDMIDVKHILCFCGKVRPSFNYYNLTPKFCSLCKKDGMVNVVDNLCECDKKPTFNFKGLKAKFCSNCKKPNMVNVNDPKCKADNCEIKGNKNYKGYCTICFQNLFPLDPLTFQIRSKTKEIAVRDFINSKFTDFQHDKPIWYNENPCDCTTKRRIDHRKLINETLLCIETDENQHKNYDKLDEEARYNDLFMAFGGKFIFIRFNPDKYKDKNGKSCNPMLVNRLPFLENEINKQIKRIENNENTDLLEVIELYYDKNT
jgi:hypothetical protein